MNTIEETLAAIGGNTVNDALETIEQGGEIAQIPVEIANPLANAIKFAPLLLFIIPMLKIARAFIKWASNRAKITDIQRRPKQPWKQTKRKNK